MKRVDWRPWFFLTPFLLGFGIFLIVPIIRSVLLAFEQTHGPGTAIWVGFHNFAYLFTDPRFWRATINTLLYASGTVFLQIPLALGLALLLNRERLWGKSVFRLVYFAPSLVGLPFVALLFIPIFEQRTGLLNVGLAAVFPWWNPDFAWTQEVVVPSIVLAAGWMYTGFNMIYFLAALQTVPKELLEAAEIDGAGPWARFQHVTLPAIMPVAGFVTLLAAIGSMQVFELPFILLDNSSGPNDAGLTVVMYLYDTGFVTGDLGYASAIGWVLALFLMGVAIVQRKLTAHTEEDFG